MGLCLPLARSFQTAQPQISSGGRGQFCRPFQGDRPGGPIQYIGDVSLIILINDGWLMTSWEIILSNNFREYYHPQFTIGNPDKRAVWWNNRRVWTLVKWLHFPIICNTHGGFRLGGIWFLRGRGLPIELECSCSTGRFQWVETTPHQRFDEFRTSFRRTSNARFSCHQLSSVVISCHQLSSVVILNSAISCEENTCQNNDAPLHGMFFFPDFGTGHVTSRSSEMAGICDQEPLMKSLSAMPWLHHLSKDLLVPWRPKWKNADRLAVKAPGDIRKVHGTCLESGGFLAKWRPQVDSIGDPKNCEVEFQNVVEALTFLKAAKNLAADTIDGQVSFSKCFFEAEDVSDLFEAVRNPENSEELQFDREFDCEATWCSAVKPFRIFAFADDRFESPWINISFEKLPEETDKLPERIALCVNSLLLPGLRLLAETEDKDDGVVINYDLDGQSPLTEYVLNSRPLPMFFGFKQLTAQAWLPARRQLGRSLGIKGNPRLTFWSCIYARNQPLGGSLKVEIFNCNML